MNTILDGHLKALKNILEEGGKAAARRKPRSTQEPFAMVLHPSRGMKREQRAKFEELTGKLKKSFSAEERRELIGELSKLPTNRVKIRKEVQIERTKYSGRAIKALGAKGGAKEQARAAKRAAAMQAAQSPAPVNDNVVADQSEVA